MENIKIIFLTGSYGNGHIQVTKALQQSFHNQGVKEILTVDLFQEAHPLITSMTKYLYIKSFTFGQGIYGMFYYRTKEMNNRKKMTKWFNRFGMLKLKDIIEKEKPDIIINTFPMLSAPELKKHLNISTPIFNVLTDFCLHNRWIHHEISKYYVASQEMKTSMIKLGINHNQIRVTGIPIKSDFEKDVPTSPFYEKYNLCLNKTTVLLMAGAFGVLKDTEKIAFDLSKLTNTQVVIICGNNKKLEESLNNQFATDNHVHVFGYLQDMHELMRIASVMITKPGGITLSESLALQLPLVLYRSVPGQERENASFFSKYGAAFHVDTSEGVLHSTKQIIDNDQLRNEMQDQMKKLYQSNSSEIISQDILQVYEDISHSKATIQTRKSATI